MDGKFSIRPYLNDVEILNQTADQIKKDLGFFQLEIILVGNKQNAYEELYSQIFPHIKTLSATNYEKLLSLLYRVDISEKQINLQQSNPKQLNPKPETFEETITHLIIKRCLQKVVLRKLFY